ncbi:MAG: DNA cytosine methyltransferase [Chloroflexaceae bacterium]|nr:DNA cytosine methyltransferase [Chloroflexaceae bacterium]
MRIIDLFAGCGGLSLGFVQAGYTLCAAFEHWHAALNVYQQNFSHPAIACDLHHWRAHTDLLNDIAPDMIIGGPPCQDFSSAGKRDEQQGRSFLTITFAEIVAYLRPKWFVMENVARAATSATWYNARQMLREAGYGLTEMILDASLCGVPQYRKRLFAIGHYGGADNELFWLLQQRLAPKPLTLRDYFGTRLGIEHYYRHPRSYQRRAVFSIDEPSPTIRGVNRPIPPNYTSHPGDTAPISPDIRPLTTVERSLIQTFPPDFIFAGTKSDVEQMIGNAVPVQQARYVADTIVQFAHLQPIHSARSFSGEQLVLL